MFGRNTGKPLNGPTMGAHIICQFSSWHAPFGRMEYLFYLYLCISFVGCKLLLDAEGDTRGMKFIAAWLSVKTLVS